MEPITKWPGGFPLFAALRIDGALPAQMPQTPPRMVITVAEIFSGTYASTAETADYLLQQLGLARRAVVK